MIDRLNQTANQWTPLGYTFICIYILEAHASDEWPVSMTNRDVKQHQDISERYQAAIDFLIDFPLSSNLPLFIDGENNCFNETYASWPFRFWAITKDEVSAKVSFKPMPKDASYDMDELDHWLEDYETQRNQVTAS